MNSPSADDLVDFINKLLNKKGKKRLGNKDINQIMNHPWLKDIEWENIESKMLLDKDIPFIPSKGDNFDFIKVNKHLDEKIKNYKSYLKHINNETVFNNFYYNFYTKNSKKSEDSSCSSTQRNSLSNNDKINNKENTKEKIDESNNDEYSLSEIDYNEEEDIIFSRLSDYSGRLSDINDDRKIKRYSYSPEKNK